MHIRAALCDDVQSIGQTLQRDGNRWPIARDVSGHVRLTADADAIQCCFDDVRLNAHVAQHRRAGAALVGEHRFDAALVFSP